MFFLMMCRGCRGVQGFGFPEARYAFLGPSA